MLKLSQQFKVQMCCQLNALATIHSIQDLVMAHRALHIHVQLLKLLQPNKEDDNNNRGVHMVKFVDQVLKFSLPSIIRLVDLTNLDKPPIVCYTPHKNGANPSKGLGLDVNLFLCMLAPMILPCSIAPSSFFIIWNNKIKNSNNIKYEKLMQMKNI